MKALRAAVLGLAMVVAAVMLARQTLSGAVIPGVATPARVQAAARSQTARPTVPQNVDSRGRSETQTFTSSALGRNMPYVVYLPPGYDSNPSARYPTLYLLHGIKGSYVQWRDLGLFDTAEALMKNGEVPPFIIVLPEGEQGYWMDHADGGPQWGTYVARDLVTEVDSHFRTRKDRAHRAIGGISMGGHGALQLALNYPELFGAVGAHSPAFRTAATAPSYFGAGKPFEAHDPVHLVRARLEAARSLRIWIDIGAEDSWRTAAEQFHQELEQLGVPHAWHESSGGHNPAYWQANLMDYLRFYGGALKDGQS